MPLKKKKKSKVKKKKLPKKKPKKLKLKKRLFVKKLLKKVQMSLLSKPNLNGLKAVQLQKANTKINTPNLLKVTMSFGEKKEKE